MLFLNILIRDLILFYSEIKLNYKKNILLFLIYLAIEILYDVDLSLIFAIIFFSTSFGKIIKKNIDIYHYNRLKFTLVRYELVYIYQILSYFLIFLVIWLFLSLGNIYFSIND